MAKKKRGKASHKSQSDHQPPTLPERRKNGIRIIPLRSWAEFKTSFTRRLFGNHPFATGRYLFRGHSNPKWKLETTFDRTFRNQNKQKRLEIAKYLISHFKEAMQRLDVPPETLADESKLLGLGQHFGLPTRLLDWTESPYVAAFFAYNSTALWGQADSQIIIWCLDTKNPIWSVEYGVEIIDVPTYGNERLRNQSGKFTLSKTPFGTLEDYVAAHGTEVGDALIKFVMPADHYDKALADLDAMGIHHGMVYPGYEGAAQWALYRAVLKHETHVCTASTPRPA